MSPRPLSFPAPFVSALAAAAVLSGAATAQSLYGLGTTQVVGFNGPKAACGYPAGPLLSLWSFPAPFPCPVPAAVAPPPSVLGDLTVDRANDVLWITDGLRIGEYDPGSTVLRGFDVPVGSIVAGPLTGLGFDANSGWLWITDGTSAAAIAPPPGMGCPLGPTVTVPAFALPLGAGAVATDVEWDPVTASLWTSDTAGMVTNVLAGGGLGAYGSFSGVAAAPCAMAGGLQSLAVDTAAPAGTLYVTDGATVYRLSAPSGTPAAPTFYSPAPCNVPPVTPLLGIGFAATSTIYGKASSGFFPSIGALGQSTTPSPNFEIQMGGGDPGDLAGLLVGILPLCPAIDLLGGLLHLVPAASPVLATQVVPPTGFLSQPTPIGPSVPAAITVYLQWFTIDTVTLQVRSSPGLEITTALP